MRGLGLLIMAVTGAVVVGQGAIRGGPLPPPQQPPAAGGNAASGARGAEENAIRAVDEAYVRAYEAGDIKALVETFAEDAEVVEADGTRYEGRAAIEQAFSEVLGVVKGAKMAVEIGSIRLITPDVAKEEGRTIVTPPAAPPVARFYTAIFVKREGRWRIHHIREEADPRVSPHDRLSELEWMIGDWLDEGSDAVVKVNCRWSDDGNFLLRSFSVARRGKPVMSVSQRVGWDAAAKQFRSWEFDSEGGFGEGRWSRDGDRWVVKHTGVRPDGSTASSTNIMVRQRDDLVRWVSSDRTIGDEAVPDGEPFTLVRVPPAPRAGSSATRPASNPNTNTNPNPRSPR